MPNGDLGQIRSHSVESKGIGTVLPDEESNKDAKAKEVSSAIKDPVPSSDKPTEESNPSSESKQETSPENADNTWNDSSPQPDQNGDNVSSIQLGSEDGPAQHKHRRDEDKESSAVHKSSQDSASEHGSAPIPAEVDHLDGNTCDGSADARLPPKNSSGDAIADPLGPTSSPGVSGEQIDDDTNTPSCSL